MFEFPELHDESIPIMAFAKAVMKLMLAAGMHDFSIRDIFKPDHQRTRRALSAIINFGKWREQKLRVFSDLQDAQQRTREEHSALTAQRQLLLAQLSALESQRSVDDVAAVAIERENNALLEEIKSLNTQQTQMQERLRDQKSQSAHLLEVASERTAALSMAEGTLRELEEQVVQSPERLQATLAAKEARLEGERRALADAEAQGSTLQQRRATLAQTSRDLTTALSLLEQVEGEITKKKEVNRLVKDLRAQIEQLEREQLHLQAHRQHVRRQEGSLMERLQRLESQSTLRKEAALSSVEQQRAQKDAIQAANEAAEAQVQDNETQIRNLQEQIRTLEAAHAHHVRLMAEKFAGVQAQVKVYNSAMRETMARGVVAI